MKTAYKNRIFDLLLNHPLGIDNFEVIDANNFSIIYQPSSQFKYTFVTTSSFDHFITVATEYAPGYPTMETNRVPVDFDSARLDFEAWLQHDIMEYKKDEAEVDLWAEYRKRIDKIAIVDDDYQDTANFTEQEKQTLKLGLAEIKGLIKERFDASEEQLEAVNKRMDYLTSAVDRTIKTDFKSIFINTVFSIVIALSLDTTKGQQLLNLFVQVLQFTPGLGW